MRRNLIPGFAERKNIVGRYRILVLCTVVTILHLSLIVSLLKRAHSRYQRLIMTGLAFSILLNQPRINSKTDWVTKSIYYSE